MKLARGLGLRGGETVAFVGAGGKTSAMFALARELPPPVVLTTTTHLGTWQAEFADHHTLYTSTEVLENVIGDGHNVVLLTGPEVEGERLTSLDEQSLQAVHEFCVKNGLSLMIEADGAGSRLLKAPASYEPVIPSWVDHVVVVSGLGGLGKSLDSESVHRPELFGKLAEIEPGQVVQVEDLAKVLGSDFGGLKGIPEGAARSLFLNQAEGEIRMAQGARLAGELCKVYERVLIGSLQQPRLDGPVFSTHSQAAAIILAAGGSERLGQPKQLLDWCGEPFVVQVVQNALTAGLAPIFVVTGSDSEAIQDVLASLPVTCVYNPDWAKGQSTSMKVGLAALPERCDRVMFLLSDQPQVSPILIRQLIERHNSQRMAITAPLVQGQRGNPVLFERETFGALLTIEGDRGGRAVFSKFKVDYVPWMDRRDIYDVDREADIAKLRDAYFPSG